MGEDTAQRRRLAGIAVAVAVVAAFAGPLGAIAIAKRSRPPSFAREVAPILANRCTGCHQMGGIAPFSLETARDARRAAPLIGEAVATRQMPPWPPGPASPAFLGSEQRRLSSHELDVLVRWARAGGPI